MVDREAAAETDASLFRLFAVAWAFAAFFHTEYVFVFLRQPLLAPKLTAVAVTAAAVATCWRPTVDTLAALALAEVIDVALLLPEVPNHWLLAGLASLAVLLGNLRSRQPGELLAHVRAPLMIAVALFYLWTGFWKLNADFFRPEVSCAVLSWERLLGFFRWLPDAMPLRHGVVLATIVMELLGPLLLLVPATRGPMVVAFVGFHVALGLDAVKVYLNFSSVMFALLLLFLPDGAVARVRRLVPPQLQWLRRLAAAGYLVLAAAGLVAGGGSPFYPAVRWLAWLPYAIGLLVLVFLAAVDAPRPRRWLPAGAAGSLAWLAPVLVMVNGLAPILGLKTRTSWQMYSNVRLEPDTSNHFVIPRSLDLAGTLRDAVTVVESSAEPFSRFAGTDLALPWIEFRRRAAMDPDAAVTWQRSGERHVTARVADDPLLSRPLPLLARKLMIFRPVGPGAESHCDW